MNSTTSEQTDALGLRIVKMLNPVKSVGMKLFWIIFVSIISCVLIVGLVAYTQSKKIIEENVSDASYQTIKQVANNMDTVLKTYEDLSLQMLIDEEIRQGILKVDQKNDFLIMREITDRLFSYSLSNNHIESIAIITDNPNFGIISTGSIAYKDGNIPTDSEWFKNAVELSGALEWIAPQEEALLSSSTWDTFGLARVLSGTNNLKYNYVIVLDIKVNTFYSAYNDIEFGDGSDLSLVSDDGQYVMNKDLSLIGNPFIVNLPTEGKQADYGQPKLTTMEDDQVLAAYQRLETTDWKLVGTIPVDNLLEDAKIIQTLTWFMVLFAIILAIAIGCLVIMTIARPLVGLRNLMVEGANGNLTVRSKIHKRQDEIGHLSDSFNEMMTQITELAKQTTRSADEVLLTAADLTDASKKTSIAAKEIAIATEEIANGATSLAVEAEKGSDLTSHINAQMKQVILANEQMSLSASEVEKASEQGTAYMGVLIEKTNTTEEMTRSMVEKVDALKESTGSIVKILDVLNSLTKQTNILSLNATIEAARAGAAGKGFMVVADEIRKLADQSRHSIDVVGQITEKIQGEIEETVRVLSDAYPLFQEQIGSVKEANEIFLSVQGQMGQFAHRLDDATGSIGQLDQSQAVLSDAMTSVSAVAEESSATSEEVASLSSEQLSISEGLVRLSDKLDAVSKGLQESLSKFKVE